MYYSLDTNERKFATLLVLSKMLATEISEKGQFSFSRKGELHHINNDIVFGDIFHKIESNLFFEIFTELQSEKTISTLGFGSYYIKDRNKLNQKIAELNSVGITLDKMRKHYNGDDFTENKKILNNCLIVKFKKNKLTINKNTGIVILNKFESKMNPGSQEFNILIKLAGSQDYKATYEDLLGNSPTKVNKRNLSFTIRNIKKCLGILPRKSAKNKDIIKNIKKHGYTFD